MAATDKNGHQLEDEQLWPMGAVTRRTGIGEHTLRAWERRFGFPRPVRLPSGHRRYSSDQVRRLMLITAALGCGHRAGDVVPMDSNQLQGLLRDSGALDRPAPSGTPSQWLRTVIEAGRSFDRDTVAGLLKRDAATLGLPRFLRERVAPLLTEIGEAWARGELDIRHEHFVSQIVEDSLRTLRAPLEGDGHGRPVVLACLPDEVHGLGLHVAALAVAAAGRSVRLLGPRTPPEEVVEAARALDAAAVGLSISVFSVGPPTAQMVTEIRDGLPSRMRVWLGGAGASLLENLPAGVRQVPALDDLERELRELPDVV